MFNALERMIAFRYLRARRKESFISVIAAFSFLGILLGVATLIIVMSVMNGFRHELMSRILGVNGHIDVFARSGYVAHYDELAQLIEKIEGVSMAIPLIETQALITASERSTGVIVRALQNKDFARKSILSSNLKEGGLETFDKAAIFVGSAFATRYGVGLDDRVQLTIPQGRASPMGTVPRSGHFRIAGIFDIGMHEYDSSYVFIPFAAAQSFLGYPDFSGSIEITLDNPNDLENIKREVSYIIEQDQFLRDWQQSNSSFFNALQVERNVMFLILTLIILVAAFNIISSMIMLVKDKSRDIAILRTMGATQMTVLRIFILTGSAIGVVGTVAGAALGIAFAKNIETVRGWLQALTGTDLFSAEIYFLSQLPAIVNWGEVISIIGMALVLSLLATIYPAMKAARMDPVEALRYE